MIDQQQAKFEGFALVEIMGHQRVAGFVTTEYRLTPCTQADAVAQQPRVVEVVFRAERPLALAKPKEHDLDATLEAARSPLEAAAESFRADLELSARPVEDLNLSARPYNVLTRADIQTIGQLVQMTEKRVLQMNNIGRFSLREIKEALDGLGLSLGMKLDAQGRLIRAEQPKAIPAVELPDNDSAEDDEDDVPY